MPGKELTEDRVDVGRLGNARHLEIRYRSVNRAVSTPERGAVVGRAEYLALALVDDLDIGVILAELHQLLPEQLGAEFGIAIGIVAVGGLGCIDVPDIGRI